MSNLDDMSLEELEAELKSLEVGDSKEEVLHTASSVPITEIPPTENSLDDMSIEELERELAGLESAPAPVEVVPEIPAKVEEKESTGEISEQEIHDIADKHEITGEEREDLFNKAPFLGANIQGRDKTFLTEAAGFMSEAVALGVPQKVVIETAGTEEMKNALGDLYQLSQKNKSWGRIGAEAVGGMLVPGVGAARLAKLATKVPKAVTRLGQLASGAGAGAVAGTTSAVRGTEAEAAGKGALLGGAFMGGAGLIGMAAKKAFSGAKNKATKELIQDGADLTDDAVGDLDTYVVENMVKHAPKIEVEKKLLRNQEIDVPEMKLFLGDKAIKDLRTRKGFIENPAKAIAEAVKIKKEQLISRFETHEGKPLTDILTETTERANKRFDEFKKFDSGEITNAIKDKFIKRDQSQPNTIIKGARFFSDNKPIAKIVDQTLGTPVEGSIDKLSNAMNEYTHALVVPAKIVDELRVKLRKSGTDEKDLYDALDTGNLGKVDGKVFEEWKDFIEASRVQLKDMGLPITKIDNYVPQVRLPVIKYRAAMLQRAEDLDKAYGNLSRLGEKDFSKAYFKDEKFKDLVDELNLGSGTIGTSDIDKTLGALKDLKLSASSSRSKLNVDSFTTKQRTGEIPNFVKSKDVPYLMGSWWQASLRDALLREGMDELKQSAKIAELAGDTWAHRWITDLVGDIVGSRTDTLASGISAVSSKVLTKFQRRANSAEKAGNKIQAWLWQSAADSPVVFNGMLRQIYPAALGLNTKAALQNLTSPILTAVPDMGVGYGSVKYMLSMGEIAKTIAKGRTIKLSPAMAKKLGKRPGESVKTRNIEFIMQNENLLPTQWSGEMLGALKEGIKSSVIGDMSAKSLEKLNNFVMAPFAKAEALARANIYFMGKSIGKDMISDPAFGNKFLKQIDSPFYQRKLKVSIDKRDEKETQRLMIDFLNSNNMFNYDRANMSNYGRYMGPMFSVFSKWPTHMAGRILSDLERKGGKKGGARIARTMVAPYIALAVMDGILRDPDDVRHSKIFGTKGMEAWTGIDAVPVLGETLALASKAAKSAITGKEYKPGFKEEGIVRSPILQATEKLATALWSEDEEATMRAFQSGYSTFGPGGVIPRFLGDDLPALLTKEKRDKGPKIREQTKAFQRMVKDLSK